MLKGVLLADGRAVGSEGTCVSACAIHIQCCNEELASRAAHRRMSATRLPMKCPKNVCRT